MRRIALAAVLVTSAATAKTDRATSEDESLVDAPIAVRATLDGTTARMVVDYRIETRDVPESPTTTLELTMPTGAVVTGATITQGGATHRMTLEAVDVVDKQFGDAFGADEASSPPSTWVAKIVLNSYIGPSYAVSVIIGAPIRTDVLVSLEVVAPTCFFRDKRYVRAPSDWQKAARTRPASPALLASCTEPNNTDGAESDAWIAFAAPQAARLPSGDRLAASTARLAITDDMHLARTELALAANLADVPRDLATVILVDESRSMSDQQRRSQREIVLGYLRAAPNSRVQVIAFSRHTRALLPAWTPASRASSRLERELASMTPRNGSNFDAGLAEAGRLLSTMTGTRRVLLITDEAMATRLSAKPDSFAGLVPSGTIINVAVTSSVGDVDADGVAILSRHDDAVLGRLAAVTTGFATQLGELDASRRVSVDAAMLVRPTSLDHIRATGLGWMDLDEGTRVNLGGETCSGSLAAGEACIWWTRGTKFAGPILLEGMLWNRRVVRLVRPLGDPGRTIARELVGTGTSLPHDEDPNTSGEAGTKMLSQRIDALAHAVTNSTSLFVRWGGDGPLIEGFGIGGFSGFGRSGSTDGIGHSGGFGHPTIPAVDLATQLRPLVAHCNLGTIKPVIKIELTFEEIVDVAVLMAATDATKRCLEEAVWDFIPTLPSLEPLRTETVVL